MEPKDLQPGANPIPGFQLFSETSFRAGYFGFTDPADEQGRYDCSLLVVGSTVLNDRKHIVGEIGCA